MPLYVQPFDNLYKQAQPVPPDAPPAAPAAPARPVDKSKTYRRYIAVLQNADKADANGNVRMNFAKPNSKPDVRTINLQTANQALQQAIDKGELKGATLQHAQQAVAQYAASVSAGGQNQTVGDLAPEGLLSQQDIDEEAGRNRLEGLKHDWLFTKQLADQTRRTHPRARNSYDDRLQGIEKELLESGMGYDELEQFKKTAPDSAAAKPFTPISDKDIQNAVQSAQPKPSAPALESSVAPTSPAAPTSPPSGPNPLAEQYKALSRQLLSGQSNTGQPMSGPEIEQLGQQLRDLRNQLEQQGVDWRTLHQQAQNEVKQGLPEAHQDTAYQDIMSAPQPGRPSPGAGTTGPAQENWKLIQDISKSYNIMRQHVNDMSGRLQQDFQAWRPLWDTHQRMGKAWIQLQRQLKAYPNLAAKLDPAALQKAQQAFQTVLPMITQQMEERKRNMVETSQIFQGANAALQALEALMPRRTAASSSSLTAFAGSAQNLIQNR